MNNDKRRIRKICKVNNYNCAECIYHEHIFDGVFYRGTKCRLSYAWNRRGER